jgi:hypothetical protein
MATGNPARPTSPQTFKTAQTANNGTKKKTVKPSTH